MLDYSEHSEWLETNALGSYASSSVTLAHTRKYHGWLVGPWEEEQYIWLNRMEEEVLLADKNWFLSGVYYQDRDYFPEGLYNFTYSPIPTWYFRKDGLQIVRELILLRDQDTLLVRYSLESRNVERVKLVLRPMFGVRNRHVLQLENDRVTPLYTQVKGGVRYRQYEGFPELWIQSVKCMKLEDLGLWYRNFKYPEELKRGYDGYEALYVPGSLILELSIHSPVMVRVSLSKEKEGLSWAKERKKRVTGQGKKGWHEKLVKATEPFIINQEKIIAGFPWFGVWSRDAMVSLPGLTLYTGREDKALKILHNFASFEQDGLLPNYLAKKANYNSVDASLWFMWAAEQYYRKTKDKKGILTLLPTLIRIYQAYRDGTSLGIRLEKNGLIYLASVDNLTWMDAKIDGYAVNPRSGYIVELNALWYRGIIFLRKLLTQQYQKMIVEIDQMLKVFQQNFESIFWNSFKGYLNDYVTLENTNAQLRPNQLWAVALGLPLAKDKKYRIVRVVKEKLFTPYGLRTLSPEDQQYCGRYIGNQTQRDLAYHNGTVWPWLLGVFTEALLEVQADKSCMEQVWPSLEAHLEVYGLGGIAEIFDGDFPHLPNGSITQAWSVAEVLRAYNLLRK